MKGLLHLQRAARGGARSSSRVARRSPARIGWPPPLLRLLLTYSPFASPYVEDIQAAVLSEPVR